LKVLGIWTLIVYLFWVTKHLWRRNQQAENAVQVDIGHQHELIAADSQGSNVDAAPVYKTVKTSPSITATSERPPEQETTQDPDKVVVVGKVSAEDTTWIDNELPE
jgi:hypothetical protein